MSSFTARRSARAPLGASLLLGLALATPSHAAESSYLLGDWGGVRTDLASRGVTFDFSNTFDFYDNVSGGEKEAGQHFDRQRFTVDADLEKLWGIKGLSFYATGVSQHGPNHGHDTMKLYTNPSGIEGAETTRLGEIFFTQKLADGRISIKVGKLDGVGEFGLQELGSTFMNDELGYVPNITFGSGLAYDPAGKPGVVVAYNDPSGFYAKAGLYAGNDNNALAHDEHGLSFAVRGPSIVAAEVGYKTPAAPGKLPGAYKLGLHYNTGDTAQFSGTGVASNNRLVYVNASQTVAWLDEKTGRRVDLGATVSFAPEDRNQNATELTAVVRVVGPFASRPLDELGLGLISSDFSDDFAALSTSAGGYRYQRETTLELTYKAKVNAWFTVQPDLQVVRDPLGDSRRSDVLILGFRTIVAF